MTEEEKKELVRRKTRAVGVHNLADVVSHEIISEEGGKTTHVLKFKTGGHATVEVRPGGSFEVQTDDLDLRIALVGEWEKDVSICAVEEPFSRS